MSTTNVSQLRSPKKHHGQHVSLFARALNITTAKETSASAVTGICNLVPRSVVDKAEEIWERD